MTDARKVINELMHMDHEDVYAYKVVFHEILKYLTSHIPSDTNFSLIESSSTLAHVDSAEKVGKAPDSILHHDLAILCADFLTVLDNFHKDLYKTGKEILCLLKSLAKHLSWHDINLVFSILSDIFSVLSTASLPIFPPLSPICTVVSDSSKVLSEVDYKEIYDWINSLSIEMDVYISKNLLPFLRRLFKFFRHH